MGLKYSSQCLDLEKRVKKLLYQLEYYLCLTDQPININKTEALFNARAIGSADFDIYSNYGTREQIRWISEYKYLRHLISYELGCGNFFKEYGD